ncbi:hypothetical protein HBI23_255320 [Parastagonospora nodorum]|nr:hypothetical protein HBI23_255320 [Parastagonospora nodorum]KAH5622239.1 hypothetical protein HBI51_248120 [Parastagonospora nodorum]KAH5983081.1 hypothetical protein HBI84_249210 [Parastagonospora nodorum]KAH6132836.1 hypothetical protein HBI68_254440 [Parastagonospora nodorum]KAH6383355.1 hypothetical protein HBI60_257300 [Parastagonospora nodorum]
MQPYERIVFVDIPDPDNFFMVLHIINSYPGQRVAVVLNTRVLDLSVTRYDDEFRDIAGRVGVERMALPLEKDLDHPAVPHNLAHFFRRDAGLDVEEVREDTLMYMVVSSLRLAAFLRENSIRTDQYDMFLQATSEGSTMRLQTTVTRPAVHHPFHVDDFKYGFNPAELDKYNEVIRNCRHPRPGRRIGLQSVCHKYIERQVKELGLKNSRDLLHSFEDLIKENGSTRCRSLVVGGPFTEALMYLKSAPKPKEIIAMAGSMKQDRNIFKNTQFNFWADFDSAKAFLELVTKKRIRLKLVPTECGKGTKTEPCPLVMHLDVYKGFLGERSLAFQMIQRYVQDKGDVSYGAFDWIAAVAATHPRCFVWIRVKYTVTGEREDHGRNIRFGKVAKYRRLNMQMASGDVQHLGKRKPGIVDAMKHVVNGSEHSRRRAKDRPMAPILKLFSPCMAPTQRRFSQR